MPDFTASFSKTFNVASCPPEGLELTIKEVKQVTLGQGPSAEQKPVVFFHEDPRGVALSKKRYATLTAMFRSPNTDKWIGQKVRLVVDPTISMGGRQCGGLHFEKV